MKTNFRKTRTVVVAMGIAMVTAVFFIMILLTSSAQAQNHDGTKPLFSSCTVELKYAGIWWNECPRNALAVGVDGRSNPPFLSLRVKCVEPVIVCSDPISIDPVDTNDYGDI